MKRSCLAITLSASVLMLGGCSNRALDLRSTPDQVASAQTVDPSEHVQAAEALAWQAAVLVQRPPHSAQTWQEARVKWRQAIRLLEAVPDNTMAAAPANRKLATYRANYTAITQRLQQEERAVESLAQAQTAAWQAAVTVQGSPSPGKWQRAADRWQQAIQLLASIPPQTTVFTQAQTKAKTYRNQYQAIERQLKSEAALSAAVAQFSVTATELDQLQTKVALGQATDVIGIDYANYKVLVKFLDQELAKLEMLPGTKSHPAYTEIKTAIDDYKFALAVWQAYLRHKEANAYWLQNDDFFNQLIPLSLIDSDRLLQQYDVEVYYGIKEAKVPLKLAVWRIWETANYHVDAARKKLPG